MMDLGFELYGLLVVGAAMITWQFARARRLDALQARAIRLFALVIGSWLYRMAYGFWFLVTDGEGHTRDFSGPFDAIMAFFFYAPNLIVAELFVRARRPSPNGLLSFATVTGLVGAILFICLATWVFITNF